MFKSESIQLKFFEFNQSFLKAYEKVCHIHNKFSETFDEYTNLESLLEKIIALENAYNVILLEICQDCFDLNLETAGNLLMKMHLQNISIIKWLVKNFQYVPPTVVINQSYLPVPPIKDSKNSANYYRVKENSLFHADGIHKQITKLVDEMKNEEKDYEKEVNSILEKKKTVLEIEPSKGGNMLYEALEVIEYHSDKFEKMIEKSEKFVKDQMKILDIKPYEELKCEVDNILKDKIRQSMSKLSLTLEKYLGKQENEKLELTQKLVKESVSIQVNFFQEIEEKYIKEARIRENKIRHLSKDISFNQTRVEKLETLLREKAIFYEEKLSKVIFEGKKRKKNEFTKQSTIDTTDRKMKIKEEVEQSNQSSRRNSIETSLEIENDTKKMKKVVKFMEEKNKNIKKLKNELDEEIIYQRSLLRIQTDDEIYSDCDSDKKVKKLGICSKEIDLNCYDEVILGKFKRIEIKDKLTLCQNVLNCSSIVSSCVENSKRNASFLMIKNLKGCPLRIERTSARKSATMRLENFIEEKTEEETSPKQQAARKIKSSKKESSFEQKEGINDLKENEQKFFHKKAYFMKIDENLDLRESVKKEIVEKDVFVPKKKETENSQIKMSFEALILNDEYVKNGRRLNTVLNELKKRRYKRSEVLEDSKKPILEIIFMLKLLKTEENAMEIEDQLSIFSQKEMKENVGQKEKLFVFDEESEKMGKKIMNSLQSLKIESKVYFGEVCKFIKYPFSSIKGTTIPSELFDDEINFDVIVGFVNLIGKVHSSCMKQPCLHINEFVNKISLK